MKSQKKWNLEPNEIGKRMQCSWRGRWLVLRCANRSTMNLALALQGAGIQAWTPLWLRKRRFPRSSVSRSVVLPCLPSFVFLAEGGVWEAMTAAEANGVPGFTVMDSYGALIRIEDRDLEGLRKVADLNPRADNPMPWPDVGSVQKIISGAFRGLTCVVISHTSRHCMVEIEGVKAQVIKIPPFLLSDTEAL